MVAGAGSGIGGASVLAFVKKGAKVVAADIVIEGGKETMQLNKEAGSETTFVMTDVSKATEIETFVNKTIETYGRLDDGPQ